MESYSRKTIRCKDYDYSQNGFYYVTMCMNTRKITFGVINKGKLILNQLGYIAQQNLFSLKDKFTNINIEEYIIMPDHIHVIIQIVNEIRSYTTDRRNMLLPKVIGFYKMNVAKQINLVNNSLGLALWQRNYYEHIIRDAQELQKIKEYIINNPIKWQAGGG